MIPVKSWLVTGIGGSRIDFLAGWLGTLDGFVDTHWRLHPVTGSSNGDSRITKILDTVSSMTLDTALGDYNMALSSDADLKVATVCHGWFVGQQVSHLDRQSYKIIFINTDNVNKDLLQWEFVVKTYLTRFTDVFHLQTKDYYLIDRQLGQNPTDEDRAAAVINILKRIPNSNSVDRNIIDLELDYNKIFCQTGVSYLEDALGIVTSRRHHEMWDHYLVMAESPKEIYCFGKLWRYSDYFEV